MALTNNLGRISAGLTADASLNIGVGVTPSGTFRFEVGTTSKFTGVATFGSTLSNGTYTYTLPGATGTLALTSDIPSLIGYVPYTGATTNLNLGSFNLISTDVTANGNTTLLGTLTGTKTVSSGSPYSLTVTQNSTNATDTGDGALSVSHVLSGIGTGTELVARSFIFSSDNQRTGGSVLSNSRVLYLVSSTQAGTTTTNLDQVYIEGGAMVGSVTNNRGVLVKTMQGTNQAAFVATGLTSANRVHLLLGTYALPTGAWSIYSSSADISYLQASLLIGSAIDDTTSKLQVTGAAKITGNLFVTSKLLLGTAVSPSGLSAGDIALDNDGVRTGSIRARNAADTGYIKLLYVDGSDNIQVGSGSTGLQINSSTGAAVFSGSLTIPSALGLILGKTGVTDGIISSASNTVGLKLRINVTDALVFATTGAATFSTTLQVNGVLTLSSTISNGTFTYTLPSATGTLALASDLSGYLPLTGGALTGPLSITDSSPTALSVVGIASISGNLILTGTYTDYRQQSYIRFSNTGGATRWGYIQHDGNNLTFFNDIVGNGFTFNKFITSTQFNAALNTSNSQLNTGSVEIQSYVVNNSWVGDNVYYNGTNFTRRNTGFASQLYFETSGAIAFFTSPSAAAGTTPSFVRSLTLTNTGAATFSGAVGIVGAAGTNGTKLFVQGSASSLFDAAGTRGISFYPSQSSIHLITSDYIGTSYYPLALSARGVASDLYINTNGNVGIGTATPQKKLDVFSDAIQLGDTGSFDFNMNVGAAAATGVTFIINGTNKFRILPTGAATFSSSLAVGTISPSATVGRIDASNDVVAFSTSDERLKENIIPITNAIDKINKIGGYTFDWKSDKDLVLLHGFTGNDVGVIAQQVAEVLPQVVTTRDSGYMAVKYEKLIPLLIEAIKEQQTQIEELKTTINGFTK